MRYEKGHKQETRRKVIETAAHRFRKHGIEATGVAALMAEAGLTHGGFYAHFPSKEALTAEAVCAAFENSRLFFAGETGEKPTLKKFIARYLSARHRDHPELGCVAAALASEVSRQSPKVRARFTESFQEAVALVSQGLPATIRGQARAERALAILSLMIGALQLARAVDNPALSESLLKQGRQSALQLAGIKK
ncbi:TetR/AcrR family transcriptional regulator [soil metagenome]